MYPGAVANNVVFLSGPELTCMVEFPVISSALSCCASVRSVAIVVATVLSGSSIFGVYALFWDLDVVVDVSNNSVRPVDIMTATVSSGSSIFGVPMLFWGFGVVVDVPNCGDFSWLCDVSRTAVSPTCYISGRCALFWALDAGANVSTCGDVTCSRIVSEAVALAAVLFSCSISGLGALFWDCSALILDFGVIGC